MDTDDVVAAGAAGVVTVEDNVDTSGNDATGKGVDAVGVGGDGEGPDTSSARRCCSRGRRNGGRQR